MEQIQKIDDFTIRITTPSAPKVTDTGIDQLKDDNAKDVSIIDRAQARIKDREALIAQATKLGAKSKKDTEAAQANLQEETPK